MTEFGKTLTLMTGFVALIAVAIAVVTRIFIYPRIDTKLKRLYMNIPKIVLGIFGFAWFLAFRYVDNVKELIEFGPGNGGIMYSKVLLLDLCPCAFFLLTMCMIFDYNSKITDVVALWAIIGASITIFGAGWFEKVPNHMSVGEYIFKGVYPNKLYYFMHAWMLIFGAYFFASSNKMKFYKTLSAHIGVVVYLVYVVIIINALGVTRNATGLVEYDWMWGEYKAVHDFLQIDFPGIMWLSYFLVWLLMILLIALKNEWYKPEKYSFWPKFAYDKIPWLKRYSELYYDYKMKVYWSWLKKKEEKENQDFVSIT